MSTPGPRRGDEPGDPITPAPAPAPGNEQADDTAPSAGRYGPTLDLGDDDARALFTRASEMQPCDACGAMPMWATAHGPNGIAERIHLMATLVRQGLFEEVPSARFGLWTDVPLEEVTAPAITNGLRGYNLTSAIEIRCRTCSRQYRQGWVTERGYESWTVTWR